MHLDRKKSTRKSGNECFQLGAETLPFTVMDYWQWSGSDLLSNTSRGILAEYIVARALGIGNDDIRDEWAAYDLETSGEKKIKIEVKSAAYIQCWYQKNYSKISFNVSKKRSWDPDTGKLNNVAKRHADVYVFALLANKDQETINPLDITQWEFYVLPTKVLNERTRSQQSITLPSLKRLAGDVLGYEDLKYAVDKAINNIEDLSDI